MATWKKIIVSGSNAHLAQITSSVLTDTNLVMAGAGGALKDSNLTLSGSILNIGANSITSTGANSVLTGSFSGSFQGNLITDLPDLTQGAGVVPFTYDGSGTATVAVSGAAELSSEVITKWDITAGKFVNSSLSETSTEGFIYVVGTSSIQLSGADSSLSGSFSGSFQGDGSGLTGVSAQVEESLNLGAGLFGGTFDGLTAITASVDSGSLAGNGLTTSAGKFAVSASDNTIAVSADGISVVEANLSEIPNTALTNSGSILGSTPVALGETVTSIAGLTLTDAQATGSFTGSFTGTFVGTTDLPDLTEGAGIVPFTYDGAGTATVAVAGAAELSIDSITKWSGDAFVSSSLIDNGSIVSGASSIQLTGADSLLSGSFSGSFQGDGSQLTGIATNLNVSGSDGTGISIDLKTQDLTIDGTANEIETTVSGTTLTIGLPDDVTIGQDLIVSRNLTVLGTASFQHTTNLDVADRFILMASGSNTTGDGGIVVQQGTQGVGETFAYDAATTRWGVTGSFDATQNSFTPEAFMATVIEGGAGETAGDVVAKLTKKGNIFIQDNEDIWIFS
jgi:hypothetical protein